MRVRTIEVIVGLFMLLGIISFLILTFKVSGFANYMHKEGFSITADFDHIGDLKVRSPVTIAGVRVGEVTSIKLDETTFRARVFMHLNAKQKNIPDDSSARILTEGLLGSNYVSLTPGYGDEDEMRFLKNGSRIEETHPALVLENLIGELLFSVKKDGKK